MQAGDAACDEPYAHCNLAGWFGFTDGDEAGTGRGQATESQ